MGKRGDAFVGRRAPPPECEGHFALPLDAVEGGEMFADGPGDRAGVDVFLEFDRGQEHLKVAPRQKHTRVRNEGGVAAQLHAVLGGAQRRCPHALTGGQQRPGQGAGINTATHREAEPPAHVAKISRFALINVFAHAAGEHHPVDLSPLANRFGEIKVLDLVRQCRA